jgi:hypothetical protein
MAARHAGALFILETRWELDGKPTEGWIRPTATKVKEKGGAPGEIRTPDLLLRRQSLYPAELRARSFDFT